MPKNPLEYYRDVPGGHQEWPLATLALLLGVASGPVELFVLFLSSKFRPLIVLAALVPVSVIVFSSVILRRAVRAAAPARVLTEAICGIALPCLWAP